MLLPALPQQSGWCCEAAPVGCFGPHLGVEGAVKAAAHRAAGIAFCASSGSQLRGAEARRSACDPGASPLRKALRACEMRHMHVNEQSRF